MGQNTIYCISKKPYEKALYKSTANFDVICEFLYNLVLLKNIDSQRVIRSG